jgi:hypothetical protein
MSDASEKGITVADVLDALEKEAAMGLHPGDENGIRHSILRVRAALTLLATPEDVGGPTPERLKVWAEWFDSPNASPDVVVEIAPELGMTAGYLLRLIAAEMRNLTVEDHNDPS